MSILTFYEKHFGIGDLVVAVVASSLAIWAVEAVIDDGAIAAAVAEMRAPFYRSLASINGSLLGFTLTGLSVCLAFGQLPFTRDLRKSGKLRELFTVFLRAMRWLAVGTVASLVAMVLDRDAAPMIWITYSILVIEVVVAVRFARCAWVLHHLAIAAGTRIQ